MSQYREGTASTTSGSNVITGVGTLWNTNNNVQPGDEFILVDGTSAYVVSSVNSDTELELNVNFPTTNTNAQYTINRDFSTNLNFVLPSKQDVEVSVAMRRNFLILDALVGSPASPIISIEGATTLPGLNDVWFGSPLTAEQVLSYNGYYWTNATTNVLSLEELTNVSIGSPIEVGNVLTWTGSEWQSMSNPFAGSPTPDLLFLPTSGGTMSGDITMDGNSILTADNVQGTGEITFTGSGTNRIADTRIEQSYMELGYYGTGYRNCYIDFHNQGTIGGSPFLNDYNARIIKYPPTTNSGSWVFQNLYEGNVQLINSASNGKIILTSDVGTTPEVRFVTAAGGSISTYVGGVLQFNIVSNQIQGPNGSAATPAYSFQSDLDCGLYRVSTNNIALSTNGSQALLINGNQEITLASNLILSSHIETGSAGSKTRYFNGGFSATTSASTLYELGRFNIDAVSTNQTITGQIRGGISQFLGISDFIIQIRTNSPVTSKAFSWSQTQYDLGREIELQVYNQANSGEVVLVFVSPSTLQNVNWTISIAERGDYDYFTETTSLTEFDPTGSPAYTEITETTNYISTQTGILRINGGSESEPPYSFDGDEDTGIYNPSANEIGFVTNSTERLAIESDGTLNVTGTTNYEDLVTSDDDIPNKKYVDNRSISFIGSREITTSETLVSSDAGKLLKVNQVGSPSLITLYLEANTLAENQVITLVQQGTSQFSISGIGSPYPTIISSATTGSPEISDTTPTSLRQGAGVTIAALGGNTYWITGQLESVS